MSLVNTRKTPLVKGFRQSAPYLNAHVGKTMVIMVGGKAIADPNFANIVSDIALLHSLGIHIVMVYGARPQITTLLEQQHYDSPYHKGIRITDTHSLEIAKQAAGQLQLDITARFSMGLNNTPMAGSQINVISGNFIIAQPLGIDDGIDFCHSGKIRRINSTAIANQLKQGSIVLLGPIASSVTGECFNLTSEEIATQVAIRLQADKLIGFCSEQGVIDNNNDIISELLPHDAEQVLQQLIDNDEQQSGTGRFLRGAITACHAGVPRSHLLSYKQDGALIQELFSLDGIGTQIVMSNAEKIRRADINDIGGILDLIQPLEAEGILVRRSREQLEREITLFSVIELDNLIIGCAALYPYPDEKMAEMACVAIHPDFRDGDRGVLLLNKLCQQARDTGLDKIFVLTTRSVHWFREQGFYECDIEQLPMIKKDLYNYQRRSKILIMLIR
ncbi:amino-acid N-acetyltransferase [Photobacterium carnosum]|uniref:Amino-acid acetyltransferase n=1 Tax=Photobacterium carnosum TaxID=2023717 RepID=A0A2N4UPH7_9GAMM|nr:amino-acid N-acetyltransferase [Photobacterium carnosum]PLC56903.1 amino-acid N-acetyltransferase [Photobacterium carnosum]